MRFASVAVLLVLCAAAWAAEECAGYSDSFDVIVVDSQLRAIEGAAVQVRYDAGTSFGEQYFTTDTRYTGRDGLLHYTIHNQGTATHEIDCRIYINGTIDLTGNKTTITATKHSDAVILLLPVYPVTIKVEDQHGHALQNATVSISGDSRIADANGRAHYFLEAEDYEYLASYMGGKQSGDIAVEGDTYYEVVIQFNPLEIRVLDDYGNPLNATLYMMGETHGLEGGLFTHPQVFGDQVEYSVVYEAMEKSGIAYPATQGKVTVVFDMHAPVFGEVATAENEGRTRLIIPIKDEGDYASGLDYSSISVKYRIEPADATTPWNDAITFASSANAFTADFPELPKNSIVSFRAEVKDKEGNKATIDGRFSPPQEEEPENNTTENGGNSHEQDGSGQEIPLLYIVGGAFIVILVIFFVFHIMPKQGESG